MKLKSIRDITILGLAVLALSVPGILRANGNFSQIYFFGDSLSDPGNVFLLTGLTAKAPYEPIPSAPYAIGGHHFSNGKTWAEVFAQRLKLVEGGKAALENFVTNGNFAFGGARARSFGDSPSALQQVGLYLSVHGTADPNALYVLQFGGNDLRDAIGAFFLFDPTGALSNLILAQAVQSIKDNIELLYNFGARHFLIANAPNLARTPAIIISGRNKKAYSKTVKFASKTISVIANSCLFSTLPPFKYLKNNFFVIRV